MTDRAHESTAPPRLRPVPVQRPPGARRVLVTGGTGYIGMPLVRALAGRGHAVRVLARPASLARARASLADCGAELIPGDALDASQVARSLDGCDTLVHMVGVAHPGPGKARQFIEIDLAAARASLAAARGSGLAHLVYLSVSQFPGREPPAMRAYVHARATAEAEIRAAIGPALAGATFLRPWYVLGPGHRWPVLLLPLYALARLVPAWRDNAARTALVPLPCMVAALVHAVEHPVQGVAARDVPDILRTGAAP